MVMKNDTHGKFHTRSRHEASFRSVEFEFCNLNVIVISQTHISNIHTSDAKLSARPFCEKTKMTTRTKQAEWRNVTFLCFGKTGAIL